MKTRKKMIILMIGGLLMFGLTACGKEQQAADSGTAKPSSEAESEITEESTGVSFAEETETESGADENTFETENTESAGGKTLVVYYSASGNTKEAAEYIAEAADGDLFELEPQEAYTLSLIHISEPTRLRCIALWGVCG